MSRLPTPVINWRWRVNVAAVEADDLQHRARLLFTIKDAMIGNGAWTDSLGAASAPTSPWTVVASSDASSADGTDRWSDITDLTWDTNGSAHSWIVLRNANLLGPASQGEILFDCSQANVGERNAAIGVYFSAVGFNVGAPSILNRPTAADELEISPADGTTGTAAWQGPNSSTVEHRIGRLHIMMSNDGRHVLWYIYRSTLGNPDAVVGRGHFMPNNDYDIAEWDTPILFQVWSLGTDVECNTWALYRTNSRTAYCGTDGVIGDFTARSGAWQFTNVDTATPDLPAISFNGATGLSPIGLAGAGALAGGFAAIVDHWWSSAATRLQQAPGDGSNQWVQIGDMLVPWNRSARLTS